MELVNTDPWFTSSKKTVCVPAIFIRLYVCSVGSPENVHLYWTLTAFFGILFMNDFKSVVPVFENTVEFLNSGLTNVDCTVFAAYAVVPFITKY